MLRVHPLTETYSRSMSARGLKPFTVSSNIMLELPTFQSACLCSQLILATVHLTTLIDYQYTKIHDSNFVCISVLYACPLCRDLDAEIRRRHGMGKVPSHDFQKLAVRMLDNLQYLHKAGVVHRDIKVSKYVSLLLQHIFFNSGC